MRSVWAPLPSSRPQSLLLRGLPPTWLPSASASGRRGPTLLGQPSAEDRHRLPVPNVRCATARSTALRGVRHLWQTTWTRRPVPALRRGRRSQRPASFARLRLPQGGDQPNQNHHRQRHSFTRHRGRQSLVRRHRNQRTIRAELTVRFPPFQLYEFPVIRSQGLQCQFRTLVPPVRIPGNTQLRACRPARVSA